MKETRLCVRAQGEEVGVPGGGVRGELVGLRYMWGEGGGVEGGVGGCEGCEEVGGGEGGLEGWGSARGGN